MIRQYLSNTNKKATLSILQNILKLNKAQNQMRAQQQRSRAEQSKAGNALAKQSRADSSRGCNRHDVMQPTVGTKNLRTGMRRDYLVRTSSGSWPGSRAGMPSKTRLAPPSAHTRTAADDPSGARRRQTARQSGTYVLQCRR